MADKTSCVFVCVCVHWLEAQSAYMLTFLKLQAVLSWKG